MEALEKIDLQNVIEFLEENRNRTSEVSLNDVMRLAEVMADSLSEVVMETKPDITEEMMAIAFEIARMKQEIKKLRVSDMKHSRIPEAGQELDAIVNATEEATNTIMEAAESIMAADPSDIEAYQQTVNAQVMEIFEACAFQDITGQRISRVISTLNFIDDRVSEFIEQVRLRPEEEVDEGPEETAEEKRARELILHGPQLDGQGVSQDDIDKLFG
ncbi:chemotaxis protein [Rhodobacteraceae bacterium RKSG542]|uniref:protein phosphatase CheZ n=1 Tax=Pseudovibrio flavus TaxID=2529854 RepID=UPI0012BCF7ED|nr:protein phosphatase CheZ [Pseudovibrio flavus]MTI18615.1 chemotaxis protein [Pseudovibrio flavus]